MPINSFEFFSRMRDDPRYQKLPGPVILAEELRSPENMGAMLRLAGNIGCRETLFISDEAEAFRQFRISRTASGGEKQTRWRIVPRENAQLRDLIPHDYSLIAVETTAAAKNLLQTSLPEKCAFLFGRENRGISKDLISQADLTVYIPVPGPVSSLNVTHALSVVLYEWLRQREL